MTIEEQIRDWERMCNENNGDEDRFSVVEIRDREEIEKILPSVLDMIKNSYSRGYKGCLNIKRLRKTTPLIKVVRDSNENILDCSIYRSVSGSMKATGVGQNKTPEGKLALQEIVKSDINPYTNWTWKEVSGTMEHYFKKYNGYPLPNEYAVMVLEKPSDKIELLPDAFHYMRVIGMDRGDGESKPDRKVIFGFKNEEIANEVLSKADYEIRRQHFNSELLEENGNEPKDFHYAVSFVNQLSDLYDEVGFRELTPGLANDLDNSIDTLNKYINYKPWVKDTLENAENLKELMPRIHKI